MLVGILAACFEYFNQMWSLRGKEICYALNVSALTSLSAGLQLVLLRILRDLHLKNLHGQAFRLFMAYLSNVEGKENVTERTTEGHIDLEKSQQSLRQALVLMFARRDVSLEQT